MTQTKWHRRQVGDKVTFNHDDHHSELKSGDEGTITEISNEEGTWIIVDFGEAGEHEVTEDEVTRVG